MYQFYSSNWLEGLVWSSYNTLICVPIILSFRPFLTSLRRRGLKEIKTPTGREFVLNEVIVYCFPTTTCVWKFMLRSSTVEMCLFCRPKFFI